VSHSIVVVVDVVVDVVVVVVGGIHEIFSLGHLVEIPESHE